MNNQMENAPIETSFKWEMTLQRLNLKTDNDIDLSGIGMPPKQVLNLELLERITNFINPNCIVCIDKEEYNCHLLVLQSYSEIFDTGVAYKKIKLSSENCTHAAFTFIYGWIIKGGPSYLGLNRENVLDIYNASKYLKISDITDQCWRLIDNVNIFKETSAYLLYIDAKEKFLPEVMELMLPRIKKFFLILVASQDWLHLDLEDVLNFLQSNYVCINSEMDIFMSAVRWLKHDWENREEHKNAVMECVRFAHIPQWQLFDIKRNPEFHDLINDQSIKKMIDDGISYLFKKEYAAKSTDIDESWNTMLARNQPAARNWSKNRKNYFNYRDFFIYLDVHRKKTIDTNMIDDVLSNRTKD